MYEYDKNKFRINKLWIYIYKYYKYEYNRKKLIPYNIKIPGQIRTWRFIPLWYINTVLNIHIFNGNGIGQPGEHTSIVDWIRWSEIVIRVPKMAQSYVCPKRIGCLPRYNIHWLRISISYVYRYVIIDVCIAISLWTGKIR